MKDDPGEKNAWGSGCRRQRFHMQQHETKEEMKTSKIISVKRIYATLIVRDKDSTCSTRKKKKTSMINEQ